MIGRINSALRRVPAWPLYPIGMLPGLIFLYWGLTNQLGADPVRALQHLTGEWALRLLIVVLAITPLMKTTRINLLKFRRALGLLVFYYAILHLLNYIVLDYQFYWPEIFQDLTKRPYIIIGMVSLLLMVPLAVTSNNASVRRLGAATWRKLHRLVYVAALAAGIHFLLVVKAWPPSPIVHLAIICALLAYRYVEHVRTRTRRRQRSRA